MKIAPLPVSLFAAALLAGCAHAPKRQAAALAPVAPVAPAISPAIAASLEAIAHACLAPALYAYHALSASDAPEERRRVTLEDYAHSFISVKQLREYGSCLDADPAAADAKKRREEQQGWLAGTQKFLEEAEAGLPDGEKLADADERYLSLDPTHAKTVLTVTRRNGEKEVLERSFEVAPEKR